MKNSMKFYKLLFISLQIISLNTNAEEDLKDDFRVLIDYTGNVPTRNPNIIPTSNPVSQIPGVPPPTGTTIGSHIPHVTTYTTTKTTTKTTSTVHPVFTNRPTHKPPIINKPINNHPLNWIASLFGNGNYHHQGHKIPSYVSEFNETSVESVNFFRTNSSAIEVGDALEDVNSTTEKIVESQQLIIRPSSSNLSYNARPVELLSPASSEPNKGVVDWVLGLVGISTGNNGGNKPPQKPDEPSKICGKCSCGVTFKQTRIVGGVETQVNAYPWMTILSYNRRFYCGASVINNKYLITATHCVNGFTKERLQAVFLDHDRSSQFETKTFTRNIAAILKHRGYNMGGTYNNDIALLRLDQELPFNGLLRPVCLPKTGKSFTGYTGIVTGWGATVEHGQVSNKLMEVDVPILSNIDCRKTGYGYKITDNMLCAGYKHGKKDSCQGDSGGPLHIINGTFHTIVGIVSWGEGCAEPNYPGVYTRVNRYISWIKSNTKDACYCT